MGLSLGFSGIPHPLLPPDSMIRAFPRCGIGWSAVQRLESGSRKTAHDCEIDFKMEGLQFSIPSTAGTHPHIDPSLFTEEQRRDLDHQSDQLYFLAGRAMSYWLRVIWWKTGFHMIGL
jgi:hypothetical protein